MFIIFSTVSMETVRLPWINKGGLFLYDFYSRVFDASSLEFIATLPKPHYLGVNVADGINPRLLLQL